MTEIQKILESHKEFTRKRNWDQFQTPKNLAMALSVEVSELVEIFMWLSDKQANSLNENQLNGAAEELADIFMYLLRVSDVLGVDLVKATHQKMEKNIERYPIEKGISLAKALVEN